MLAFRQGMATPPREVRLVHGDPDAKQALQAEIERWARGAGDKQLDTWVARILTADSLDALFVEG